MAAVSTSCEQWLSASQLARHLWLLCPSVQFAFRVTGTAASIASIAKYHHVVIYATRNGRALTALVEAVPIELCSEKSFAVGCLAGGWPELVDFSSSIACAVDPRLNVFVRMLSTGTDN